eukprot:564780-Heterocapsa_arctica.AAC.1
MAEDDRTFLEEQHLTFIEPIVHTQHFADHVRYADDLLTVGLANYFELVRWRLEDWQKRGSNIASLVVFYRMNLRSRSRL